VHPDRADPVLGLRVAPARVLARDVRRSSSAPVVQVVDRVVLAAVPAVPQVLAPVRGVRVVQAVQVEDAVEVLVGARPERLDAVVKRASQESRSAPSAKNLR
jgi:hypothetical protein